MHMPSCANLLVDAYAQLCQSISRAVRQHYCFLAPADPPGDLGRHFLVLFNQFSMAFYTRVCGRMHHRAPTPAKCARTRCAV
jgi:hypothetical protein